jgi:hypothetical protein
MAVWPIEGPTMIQCELKKRLNEFYLMTAENGPIELKMKRWKRI